MLKIFQVGWNHQLDDYNTFSSTDYPTLLFSETNKNKSLQATMQWNIAVPRCKVSFVGFCWVMCFVDFLTLKFRKVQQQEQEQEEHQQFGDRPKWVYVFYSNGLAAWRWTYLLRYTYNIPKAELEWFI